MAGRGTRELHEIDFTSRVHRCHGARETNSMFRWCKTSIFPIGRLGDVQSVLPSEPFSFLFKICLVHVHVQELLFRAMKSNPLDE